MSDEGRDDRVRLGTQRPADVSARVKELPHGGERRPQICSRLFACPTCFRISAALAEATYLDLLYEVGPLWLCPDCFDVLSEQVDGLELTGRMLGDLAAFGRRPPTFACAHATRGPEAGSK